MISTIELTKAASLFMKAKFYVPSMAFVKFHSIHASDEKGRGRRRKKECCVHSLFC